MVLASLTLPDAAAGWKAAAAPARYDAQTIFQYLDGHGEVYLAYGMVACLAQRYAGPAGEGDVIVDVFEMDSPAGAYGVFTHSRDGEPVEVGQGATLAYGTLLFWKGRHFVSVYSESESAAAKDAVMALGRAVDSALTEKGEIPALVGLLPPPGSSRSPSSGCASRTCSTRTRGSARATYWESARRRLRRSADTPARAERRSWSWSPIPTRPTAATAAAAFAVRYLDGDRPRRHEDGWYAAGAHAGDRLVRAFVLRASSRETAEALLVQATGRTER